MTIPLSILMKREVSASSTFVNERMCIEDWLAGKLSSSNLHNIINSADIHFIKNKMDTMPYNELSKVVQRYRFNYRRLAKRLLYILK